MPMPHGAALPSSRRISDIISPALRLQTRSPAMRINGSRFPWVAGCFSAGIRESVAQAFRSEVSYMPGKPPGSSDDASDTFNPFTNSVQWSRRFIGLKLFMALAERGEAGYVEMIDHQTRMGHLLRELLEATGWRIVNSTPLPLVCFTRDGLVPSVLLAALREHQIAWMSEAVLGGCSCHARLHHQLQNNRTGHSLGSGSDESSVFGVGPSRKDELAPATIETLQTAVETGTAL